VYNAANEECVAAFQEGELAFPAIVDTVAATLAEHPSDRATGNDLSLDDVLAADSWARVRARELVEGA
jgi:1-deoxy-D-xylulose-5-phosphate reductoisomerase